VKGKHTGNNELDGHLDEFVLDLVLRKDVKPPCTDLRALLGIPILRICRLGWFIVLLVRYFIRGADDLVWHGDFQPELGDFRIRRLEEGDLVERLGGGMAWPEHGRCIGSGVEEDAQMGDLTWDSLLEVRAGEDPIKGFHVLEDREVQL